MIPVKDDREALERVLGDLASQTRAADEIVIVDNAGSQDLSDLASRYGLRLLHEPTPGIAAAASTGYDAARFSVIARCDADSRLSADWIERIAESFGEQDVGAVSGPGHFYGYPSGARRRRAASAAYMGLYRASMHAALGHPPLFGSNCAFRNEAWRAVRDRVHRSRTDIHDDVDLSVHLGEEYRIVWNSALRVGVSADALTERGTRRIRLARGWRSLSLHWPQQSPLLRWRRRLLGRLPRRG